MTRCNTKPGMAPIRWNSKVKVMVPRELDNYLMGDIILRRSQSNNNTTEGGIYRTPCKMAMFNSEKVTSISSTMEEENENVGQTMSNLNSTEEETDVETTEDQNQVATNSNSRKSPRAGENRRSKVIAAWDNKVKNKKKFHIANLKSIRRKQQDTNIKAAARKSMKKKTAADIARRKERNAILKAAAEKDIWVCDTNGKLQEEGANKTFVGGSMKSIRVIYIHARDQHNCRFTCNRTRVHIGTNGAIKRTLPVPPTLTLLSEEKASTD